jgi:UV DNA damage endonuclease
MNTRLGYACINMTLRKESVCCNKTCRLATAINQGVNTGHEKGSIEYSKAIYDFLSDYGQRNLFEMYKIISWFRKNGINFYRMSSDMFPHVNNHRIREHMTQEDWDNYSNLVFGRKIIWEIGSYAQKYQIRLTMHPGHYNQLGSKSADVISNTVADLSWQALLLELLFQGAEAYNTYLKQNNRPVQENILHHGILCIHGGGTYGNKAETIERWKANFGKLPEYIQNKIALENDERGYSVEDLLPICDELGIPLIFDFHHYNCWAYYHESDPYQKPICELLPKILNTWKKRGKIPKFHLSDQAKDKKIGAHHDYVESIPDELLKLMSTDYRFDIMIEAKQKELATLKLYNKYRAYFKK